MAVEHQQELPGSALLPAHPDAQFDRMAALTRRLLDAPVALVTLPTATGQVFPGVAGVEPQLAAERTNGLEYSYCMHVVRSARPMIVGDTRQVPEFAASLSTIECGIRAYAGMPLRDGEGRVVGSLCAMDLHPREWTTDELEILADLAEACSSQLQLRIVNARTAVTADRDRMGRELGDGVIREMFGLSMHLGSLRSQVDDATGRQLTVAIESIDRAVLSIRKAVFDIAT